MSRDWAALTLLEKCAAVAIGAVTGVAFAIVATFRWLWGRRPKGDA